MLSAPASVRDVAVSRRRYAPGVQRLPTPRRRAPRRPSPATPPSVHDLNPAPAETRVARELEFEGEVWSVVLLGAATVGRGMGTGAQVLHLGFEAPVGAADPGRTAYVAAGRFEDVHDDVLRKLLSEATGTDEAERRSAAGQS
ncbi:MAG: hypothetical protein OXG18_01385 [Gemmatimonadetes bacterium]|nr:hypothetical protein [Gemmatimonadota bacterium]